MFILVGAISSLGIYLMMLPFLIRMGSNVIGAYTGLFIGLLIGIIVGIILSDGINYRIKSFLSIYLEEHHLPCML